MTVEANPNSLRAEHLLAWREWRVTRVSVGVQSFDGAELEMMGRLHGAAQAHEALSAALAAGFAVSADFIFGLPHQSLENWARTLREAVRCGLSHISLYQLSLEEGTPWENLPRDVLPDGYAQYRWGAVVFAAPRLRAVRDSELRTRGTREPPQPQLLARGRISRNRPQGPQAT